MTAAETFTSQRGDRNMTPGNDTDSPLIRIEDVSKRYRTRHADIDALSSITLDIQRGEIFGIIGRSGAGKSTLLRALNRLEPIDQGRVLFDNIDIQRLPERRLLEARRRIGMIFQHFNLLNSATVLQNLALPLKAAGIRNKSEIHERAHRMLELVGLADKSAVYPTHLSGGQKQRVGIARALMLEPEVLLCDEATSALDPETTESILALIRAINRKLGLTVVLITHEMSVIRQICDRVAVLENGKLAEVGQVWRIFGQPGHEATRALLAPLAPKIADDVQDRLSAHPTRYHDHILVKWHINGHDPEALSLTSLADHFGPGARLIQSRVERLQNHSQGELLLEIPVGSMSTAIENHPGLKVIGYVAASV